MKTLKYLTICFVVCCLFSSNVFAECSVGQNVEITAELYSRGSGVPANVGLPGDDVYYTVTINRNGLCPLLNGEPFAYIPDGIAGGGSIEFDLADDLAMPSDTSVVYTQDKIGQELMYTIESLDAGTLNAPLEGPPLPQFVRAYAQISGNSVLEDGPLQPGSAIQVRDTEVLIPCLEVVKVPICAGVPLEQGAKGFTKVGDPIQWQITITNCSDQTDFPTDLDILSIEDSLLGTLSSECPANLDSGAQCIITTAAGAYTVTEADLAAGTIDNTVTVEAIVRDGDVQIGESFPVSDDAVVDVDDACLTCDVQCDEATGLFTVTLENCGTKDLDVVAEPAFSGRILAGNTEVITGVQGAPTPGAGLCGSGGGTELIINWTADVAEDQCNLFDRLEGTCSDECPGTPCTVEFDVVKICDSDRDGVEDVECDLESGDIASYLVTVNYDITGECGIYFELTDVNAGVSGLRVPADGCVEGSGSVEVYVEIEVPECELGQSGEVLMPNVASVEAICCDGESTGITEESNEANCCYECCEPDFEVEKICDSDQDLIEDTGCIQQGGTATAGYTIWVHNTGTCDLLFLLNDEQAGIVDLLVGPIPAGQSSDPIFGVEPVPVCLEPGQSIPMDENVACAVAFNLDGSEVLNPDGTVREECDSATCCYDCPGGEGCTPGFWKNHPDCWCDEIVLSDGTVVTIGEATLVSSVFTRLQSAPYDTLDTGDRKSDFDTDSLADSIRYRGGAELAGSTRNMLRHATAALLNACTSDVNYPISAAMVVDLVNFVLDEQDIGMIQNLHTLLADWNEDSPCPIDAHCIRHDDVINGD